MSTSGAVEPGRGEKTELGALVGEAEQWLLRMGEGMRGCGSKVRTPAGVPSFAARATGRSDDRPMAAMHPVEIAQREDRATERIIGRGIAHDAKAFRRHRVSMVKEPLRVGAVLGGRECKHPRQKRFCVAGNCLLRINRPFNHAMLASLSVQRVAGALDHGLMNCCKAGPRQLTAPGSRAMALDPSMPVLVVDDYSTMVRIIRNLLRQQQYVLVQA